MRSCPDTDIDPAKKDPKGVTGGGGCLWHGSRTKKDHGSRL